jgi:NAD-dependent SIR2 family protein deacetylase
MTFLKSEGARKSYWARNFVGWPRWSSVEPNVAHVTLADWERASLLQHIITQNVDQLHFKVRVLPNISKNHKSKDSKSMLIFFSTFSVC